MESALNMKMNETWKRQNESQRHHPSRGWLALPALCAALALLPTPGRSAEPAAGAEAARAAVKNGTFAFRLTTPEELKAVLGKPVQEKQEHDGDMTLLIVEFPEVRALFGRMGEGAAPFTLFQVTVAGETLDIGRERQIALRTKEDLKKLDFFWGVAGVSLARLDLRDQLKTLEGFTFDTLTVWPAPEALPSGFNPARLLEQGRNPGLGVRKLHQLGIDGRGVGIAIIDQPLLRDHEDYKDRITRYEGVEVDGVKPQMHGPCVASIAVGRTCGVAPGAALYYYAVPPWKWVRNEPWAELLERIVASNEQLQDTPKIRAVSISLGAFSERPNHSRWQQAVAKAEQAGILVVTCDPAFLRLGTLRRVESAAEPGPADYTRGRYFGPGAALWVPVGNRTMASFRGPTVYTYDRTGGMSWTVPYLAGVAALSWQVDPKLKPAEIVGIWRETAVKTAAGPVVDPAGVIAAVEKRK